MGARARPLIHVDAETDARAANGLWLRSWHEVGETCNTQFHSPAGKLWAAVKQRCRGVNPRYSEVVIGFRDFQDFAEWCSRCPGYREKDENGALFHLDKDLRGLGRKTYSEETCCFIPARLNSLFIYSNASRGRWPLGVHWAVREGCFKSQLSDAGKKIYLGRFTCPLKAHKAWQIGKIAVFEREASSLPHSIAWLRPYLLAHAQRVRAELTAGMETTR